MTYTFWQNRPTTATRFAANSEYNNLVLANSNFVISGCDINRVGVSSSVTTISVASGKIFIAGTGEINVSPGNVTIDSNHPTLNRIDLIAINTSGTRVVIKGTAALVPRTPLYNEMTHVVLGFAYVTSGTGGVSSQNLIKTIIKNEVYNALKTQIDNFVYEGAYNAADQDIYNIKNILFVGEHNNGTLAGSPTINWNNGNMQYALLNAVTTTFSFTAPTIGVGNFDLRFRTNNTDIDINWPASVKWIEEEPDWSFMEEDDECVVTFRYNGTTYLAASSWFYKY